MVSATDAGLVVACAAAFTAGARLAGGSDQIASPASTLAVAAALLAICAACALAGTLLLHWSVLSAGVRLGFPARFIAGYVVVSSSLFALAWVSPLPIGVNFAVVSAVLVVLSLALRLRFLRGEPLAVPVLAATLVSLVAALLWAQDTIRPTQTLGDVTVFKPWIDSFYHAIHIRLFGDARGAATIEDFRMAGVSTRLYHYVPYMIPALARALSGLPAYAAFGGILVPLGITLTGLAAWALASSWWGAWPGLVATMALLLLPDGAQLVGGNGFLAYHWMQQVGPGGLYGTAVLALAWLFVLEGCRTGRRAQLAAGWVLAGLVVGYKAQLFVANAFLLWMLPPLAFRGLRRVARAAWAAGALVAFLAGLALVGERPGVPVLRLDGSSTLEFLSMLRQYAQPGVLTDAFDWLVPTARSMTAVRVLGAAYLVTAVVGLLVVAYPLLAVMARRRLPTALLVLPALTWASFAIMALGLAMDNRGVGMREELLHRPFVWTYFLTATWVGGAVGWLLLQGRGGAIEVRQRLAILAAVVLLVVPFRLGRGVQRLPQLPFCPVAVPTGLVQSAVYLRGHAGPTDLVQESGNDRVTVVSALAERRPFILDSLVKTGYEPAEIQRRVGIMTRFKAMSDPATIEGSARELELRWFILAPGDAVRWPPALLAAPVFQAGGFRVFKLY